MSVTAATFQPPMSPNFVVAVLGLVVHSDAADLMLLSVMGVSRATAPGESSISNSNTATAQNDDVATWIAHRLVLRGSLARTLFLLRAGSKRGGMARRGVGSHLGRLANAEMAVREARGVHEVGIKRLSI
jgi:hypothetical protein